MWVLIIAYIYFGKCSILERFIALLQEHVILILTGSSSWIMEVQVIIFQVMQTLSSSFSFHWRIWKMLFTELPGFLTLIEIVYIKFLAHKIALQMWVLAITEVVFILINVHTHFLSTNEIKFQDKMKQFLATFVMRSQLTGLLWLTLYTLQFLRNSSVLTS